MIFLVFQEKRIDKEARKPGKEIEDLQDILINLFSSPTIAGGRMAWILLPGFLASSFSFPTFDLTHRPQFPARFPISLHLYRIK